jgi:5-methylthioadenosine/S-adenosylhomocysteine deaminase
MESQSILIKNVTMPLSPVKKGSVLVEDDLIVDVGPDGGDQADVVIDGAGKVLIPGLVNTHTHLSMSLLRGMADDLPLETWLEDYIWPAEAHLDGDHCYVGALLAALEMIRTGTTCCNDMYFFMDHVARALDEAGLRGVISHGMIDTGDEEKRKKEIKETERIIGKCHDTAEGRIKVALGPHAPYTCSEELLRWSRDKADQTGLKIHIHVSETEGEVQNMVESTQKRPFEYLDSLGILGPDLLAAHAIWLNDDEISLVRDRDVKLSHNPISNMKLASGISPVTSIVNRGVCVSLGTDGAASNNNLDLFQEIKTATLLQKVNHMDPTVLPVRKVLEMATKDGARALGLEDEIGTIEAGKKADLVLVDMKAPHLTPPGNYMSHLVYSAEGSDVDTVICNGQILMQGKEFLVLDPAEVMDLAREASEDLLNRS